MSTFPTALLRYRSGSYSVGEDSWDELVDEHGDLLEENLNGMKDQLICHVVYGAIKDTYNLDEWRPDVGYQATVEANCDPTEEDQPGTTGATGTTLTGPAGQPDRGQPDRGQPAARVEPARRTAPSRPVRDSEETPTTSVYAGGSQSCAIRADASLWCWGYNEFGQVGNGTTTNGTAPVRVGDTTATWISVGAGTYQTCAVRAEGTLWCWGNQRPGASGTDRLTPKQVGRITTWASVTAGERSACALRTDGTAWCWDSSPGTSVDRLNPRQVGRASDWVSLTSGGYHTCGIRAGGTLWCWGLNVFGQIGDGTDENNRSDPVQIGGNAKWAGVTAGYFHTCATRTNGTLWCWGRNYVGQLGDGGSTDRLSPRQVGREDTWTGVAAGDYQTCATRSNGTLWCWGDNYHGQLGDGSTTNRSRPVQVAGSGWAGVTTGVFHTCATRTDDSVWCWGEGVYGQLGYGVSTDGTEPARVTFGGAEPETVEPGPAAPAFRR